MINFSSMSQSKVEHVMIGDLNYMSYFNKHYRADCLWRLCDILCEIVVYNCLIPYNFKWGF